MTSDPELLVIVPSRGRPAVVDALLTAAWNTCTARTLFAFAVDDDDPTLAGYADGPGHLWHNFGAKTMVAALNGAAAGILSLYPDTFAVAFMGDDHRPRTPGWDSAYLDALHELGTGIVYGDDLLQGENIPTQVAMTADIVRTLGHMAPPTLTHLFVDNYWRDLGQAAGCLRYLPDVVVEHLHPFAGKAPMDEGYTRVNDHSMYRIDALAYAEYAQFNLLADVAKVKALP